MWWCAIHSRLFGIPVVLDESPSQQVIDFIFDKYTTKPVQNEQTAPNDAEVDGINDDAIEAFLKFVSNISTEFDGEALALLKYYFIVTRSVRPSMSSIFFLSWFFFLKCLIEILWRIHNIKYLKHSTNLFV